MPEQSAQHIRVACVLAQVDAAGAAAAAKGATHLKKINQLFIIIELALKPRASGAATVAWK